MNANARKRTERGKNSGTNTKEARRGRHTNAKMRVRGPKTENRRSRRKTTRQQKEARETEANSGGKERDGEEERRRERGKQREENEDGGENQNGTKRMSVAEQLSFRSIERITWRNMVSISTKKTTYRHPRQENKADKRERERERGTRRNNSCRTDSEGRAESMSGEGTSGCLKEYGHHKLRSDDRTGARGNR